MTHARTMEDVVVDYDEESFESPRKVFKLSTGLELYADPEGRWGFWVIKARKGNNRVPEKLEGCKYTSEDEACKGIHQYLENEWNPTKLSPKNRTFEVEEEKREPNATASNTKR